MKSQKQVLELVKKGFTTHKDNLTKQMAEIKAKEMEARGCTTVIVEKNNSKYTVYVGYENKTATNELPEFSPALKGHLERKAFIKENNIPLPDNATSSKQLQAAIEIWFNNK